MDSLEEKRTENLTENIQEEPAEYAVENANTESSHNTDKLMKQIDRYEKGFKNYHWFLIQEKQSKGNQNEGNGR